MSLFHKKNNFVFLFLFFNFLSLYSQNLISYKGSGNYILRERSDLRRYDNGKYFGLVSQEVSSYITPVSFEDHFYYEGYFYLLQDTRRNSMYVSKSLNDSIPSKFKINKNGQLVMIEDNGFPTFRSFPTFSENVMHIGDIWEAKAERAVDPLNKGIITKMPIYVQYKYIKDDFFKDEPVFVIQAQWATRYGMGTGNYYIDWGGDKDLQRATGSHKATIYVSKISGNSLLIQDLVDETFIYADGNQYQFKGTISLFTEYPPTIDRSKIIPALRRIADISDIEAEKLSHSYNEDLALKNNNIEKENIENFSLEEQNLKNRFNSENTPSNTKAPALVTVDNTPAGIRLTIPNLQFKANSSELLNNEDERLSKIAEVLKEIPGCKFLVEGHTASTGLPEGEMQLSIERAQSISNALCQKGISKERIICKGSGGTKPIADNSTSEGKAKNRRVEITILE